MKIKDLIEKLSAGNPEADVYVQENLPDGYFVLSVPTAFQPEGHSDASGFVIHVSQINDENPHSASFQVT